MSDPTEPYVVTITERGSQIYTGTSLGQLSAMMLAQVTLMMQGVFANPSEVATDNAGLTELIFSANGRTLNVRIESHSSIAMREVEKSTFDDIVSGSEDTP